MKFDESLLTAYLDGELSDEERAVVERQLAQSSAHRETLRAMARVQQQLAALPAESFSTDVVAEVRRRIAAGHAAAAEVEPGAAAGSSALTKQPSDTGASLRWHLWVPLALAAGLLAVAGFNLLRRPVEVALTERPASDSSAPPRTGPLEPSSLPPVEASEGKALDAADERIAPMERRRGRAEPGRSVAEPGHQDRDDAMALGEPDDLRQLAESREASPAAGGMGGGMGGGMSGAYGQPRDDADSEPFRLADDRLPEGARLYRFSVANGETLWRRLERGTDGDGYGDRLTRGYSSSPSAAAPVFSFEVPEGEVAATLHWMTEQLGLDEGVGDQPDPSRTDAEASSEPERAAAVLVEAPPERLRDLLHMLRREITQRYGTSAVLPTLPPSEQRGAFSDGAAILVIEPADADR